MRFRYGLLGLSLAICMASLSQASVVNGGFESGLTGWTTTGNASVQTAAFGTPPTQGVNQGLLTTGSDVVGGPAAVVDGAIEAFLGLTPGTLDGLSTGNATVGSAMKQEITVTAGDMISFDFNYLTDESTPAAFNDMAFWSLTDATGAVVLQDTDDMAGVGFVLSSTGFNEETGYNTVTHTFTSSGTFTLGFGVVDVGDEIVDSGLLIDNVQIQNQPVPEPGSMAIWALGGAMVVLRRRRKKATA